MSLVAVKDRISKFLSDDEPQVVSLSGKWGAGKTFIWIKTYEDMRRRNKLNYADYSYVSLFSVNSLSELKMQIGANFKKNTNTDKKLDNILSKGENILYKLSGSAGKFFGDFSLGYKGVGLEVTNVLSGLSYYGVSRQN